MVVGQVEIAAILNLQLDEELPPWWRDINLGVVAIEDQPSLDQLFPDNLSPSQRVSRLLEPPGDLSGFESAAKAMRTSPLSLSCEFAERGEVEAAIGYFHLELVQVRKTCEVLDLDISDSSSPGLLETAEERRRTLEKGYGPLIKGIACRQAEEFSRSLVGIARNGDLASRLWEEAEAFANHASEFEELLDLRG